MKKFFSILVMLVLSVFAIAQQKQLSEATLNYAISVATVGKEAQLPSGFDNAQMVLYLKPFQSREEFTTSMGSETNVYDSRQGKGFILKEFGQKLMITLTKPDWQLLNRKNDNVKFSISTETYDIAGYKCKKATGKMEEGKDIVIYFNPAITLANTTYHNAFPQLPGVPVQFELQSGNIRFTYTLKSIDENTVVASKFEAPKSGYRVMTFQENQQLKKGVGK